MKEYLSKTVRNLHQRNLQSDITTMKTFRELCEARTPDSAILWNRDLCRADPTCQFRGRWRQLSDRLNTIAEYIMKSNVVVPITGSKHAENLRTTAELLMEVMQQIFYHADILAERWPTWYGRLCHISRDFFQTFTVTNNDWKPSMQLHTATCLLQPVCHWENFGLSGLQETTGNFR